MTKSRHTPFSPIDIFCRKSPEKNASHIEPCSNCRLFHHWLYSGIIVLATTPSDGWWRLTFFNNPFKFFRHSDWKVKTWINLSTQRNQLLVPNKPLWCPSEPCRQVMALNSAKPATSCSSRGKSTEPAHIKHSGFFCSRCLWLWQAMASLCFLANFWAGN